MIDHPTTVTVTLVDSERGNPLTVYEHVLLDDLMPYWNGQATLEWEAVSWRITQVVPATPAAAAERGGVDLYLAPLFTDQSIQSLYTVPTVADCLPDLRSDSPIAHDSTLWMPPVAWRQVELVSRLHMRPIANEVEAITAVLLKAAVPGGFTRQVIRQSLPDPISENVDFRTLVKLLPEPTIHYSRLAFDGMSGAIVGGEAFGCGGMALYVRTVFHHVRVIGLYRISGQPLDVPLLAPAIQLMMDRWNLLLVDWPRTLLVNTYDYDLPAYLSRLA